MQARYGLVLCVRPEQSSVCGVFRGFYGRESEASLTEFVVSLGPYLWRLSGRICCVSRAKFVVPGRRN